MKSKQVLSIEQMKRLQELGLDTSDASMNLEWKITDEDNMVVNSIISDSNYDLYHPTYTLQDILDKLPPSINWNPLIIVGNSVMYSAGYGEGYDEPIKIFKEESLLESAYKMLCWALALKNAYPYFKSVQKL